MSVGNRISRELDKYQRLTRVRHPKDNEHRADMSAQSPSLVPATLLRVEGISAHNCSVTTSLEVISDVLSYCVARDEHYESVLHERLGRCVKGTVRLRSLRPYIVVVCARSTCPYRATRQLVYS